MSKRIAKNPGDVQAIFTLGRVHYFAFAGSTDVVNVLPNREDSPPVLYDFLGERGKGTAARAEATRSLSKSERLAHLKQALINLSRATALTQGSPPGDDNGLCELCLACALEDGAPFASAVGPIAGIPSGRAEWTAAALTNYGVAFDKAVQKDSQIDSRPIHGLSTLVSYEAARSYQRLISARQAAPNVAEKLRLDRMTRFIESMGNLPVGAITPLIFSLDRGTDLPDLLSGRTVDFNLNGSDFPQRYGWVQSNTAILVWDPHGSGQITSGRQLFGSVTWWMFWDDAYEALRVLDDDGNGWLEASELRGLALWFDRNQDGISEPGEVVPIEVTPIVAIATQATGRVGGVPMNSAGLRLRDGSMRPTYDWIATPVRDTTSAEIPPNISFQRTRWKDARR